MSKLLFIITGPSGAGKNTVMNYVRRQFPQVTKAVTYTTRAPRPHEKEGVDYRYISESEFFRKFKAGKILEYEQVYNDYYYGSPADVFEQGNIIIMEMDWKGHRTYREHYTDERIVSIFLVPPSLEEITKRIVTRSRVDNLQSRLTNALDQLEHAHEYTYIILNDDKTTMLNTVQAIVRVELLQNRRQENLNYIKTILQQSTDLHS